MKTGGWFSMVVLTSAVILVLYGCPKKAEVSSAPEPQQQVTDDAARAKADELAKTEEARKARETAAAADAARKAEEEQVAREAAAKREEGLKPIHFDFDRSFVRTDAASVMKANADWLRANPKVTVRIEGNCDERGTKEYNHALGQRRSAAAKKYLAKLGIAAKRITLISYGKERLVCQESSEDCWQKNRRADLVPVTE